MEERSAGQPATTRGAFPASLPARYIGRVTTYGAGWVASLVGIGAFAACAGGAGSLGVSVPVEARPRGIEPGALAPDAAAANALGAAASTRSPVETSAGSPSADVATCPQVCQGRATAPLGYALQMRAAETRRCYNQALASDPTLAGTMTVLVRIAEDGSTCQTRVLESDMTKGMTACALRFFDGADANSYPPPVGGCIDATVPMRFTPMTKDAGVGGFD